jgi:hypothetical protein
MSEVNVVFVRRQFYEGVARVCLRKAWRQLNAYRQTLWATRQFRGKVRRKQGLPLAMIAVHADRDEGTVARWFQGDNHRWPNLTLVMMTLRADWKAIGAFPEPATLIRGGWSHTLRVVRGRLEDRPLKKLDPPTTIELEALVTLFSTDRWRAARRLPEPRRRHHLAGIAGKQAINSDILDAADRAWGDSWESCLPAVEFWLEQLRETDQGTYCSISPWSADAGDGPATNPG